MIQHSPRPRHVPATPRLRHAVMPLCAALAACSADVVNMGENEEAPFVPPPHSVCVDSPVVSGNVEVRNQTELDALEGCTTIEGHLFIRALFEPDLRPLHELRVVRGEFGMGISYIWGSGSGLQQMTAEDYRLEDELLESGRFLASLEGLERLEAVGSLQLRGVAAASFEPLAGLRQLTEHGQLTLFNCDAVVDLSPLAGLSGIQVLSLRAANLESLDGLQLSDSVQALAISGRKLANIDALSSVRAVTSSISIDGTALLDLAGLDGLEEINELNIVDNPALESLHGLGNIFTLWSLTLSENDALHDASALADTHVLGNLSIYGNDGLRQLTGPNWGATSEFIAFVDNALLEELPAAAGTIWSGEATPENRLYNRGELRIVRNPKIQRAVFPSGLRDAVLVVVEGNTALRELDLGDLETLDLLRIQNNASLGAARLDALDTVDRLEVVDNPLLAPTTFDAVRTFQRTMTGNAEDAL